MTLAKAGRRLPSCLCREGIFLHGIRTCQNLFPGKLQRHAAGFLQNMCGEGFAEKILCLLPWQEFLRVCAAGEFLHLLFFLFLPKELSLPGKRSIPYPAFLRVAIQFLLHSFFFLSKFQIFKEYSTKDFFCRGGNSFYAFLRTLVFLVNHGRPSACLVVYFFADNFFLNHVAYVVADGYNGDSKFFRNCVYSLPARVFVKVLH